MKYISTGNSDMHIKYKITDTTQLRAYITALVISQGGHFVIFTVAINTSTNTINSWDQVISNSSFHVNSVNIEKGGLWIDFGSEGVWGVCQYWGTGISI